MLNEEVNKCQRKIVKWRTKLKDLQDACPHTDAVKVNKANTGIGAHKMTATGVSALVRLVARIGLRISNASQAA